MAAIDGRRPEPGLSDDELREDAVEAGYPEPACRSVFASEPYAADVRDALARTRELARVNRPMIPNGFDLGEVVGAAQAVAVGERSTDEGRSGRSTPCAGIVDATIEGCSDHDRVVGE